MKVCILINTLRSGGGERQAVNLAKMLKMTNNDVSIVTYFGDNFFADELKEYGISYVVLHCTKVARAILVTRKQIKRGRYDVVIAFLRSPILCACAASLVGKRWKLITRLGSADEAFFSKYAGKIMLRLIRVADSVVCNSYLEQEMWLHYSQLPDSRVKVIYNIYPDIIKQTVTEMKYGEHKRKKIVVPASYSRIKNVQNVIQAVGLLDADEQSRLEIHWYGQREIATGNTREYDQAIKLVKELGLDGTVYLHNETKEIYNKMRGADYVGLFSFFEGLPNAICEAMLLGVPVIMTRVSDYRRLVDGNGYICTQDPESISNVLKKILSTSESERRNMAMRSSENAKVLLSYEVLQRKWLDILSGQEKLACEVRN